MCVPLPLFQAVKTIFCIILFSSSSLDTVFCSSLPFSTTSAPLLALSMLLQQRAVARRALASSRTSRGICGNLVMCCSNAGRLSGPARRLCQPPCLSFCASRLKWCVRVPDSGILHGCRHAFSRSVRARPEKHPFSDYQSRGAFFDGVRSPTGARVPITKNSGSCRSVVTVTRTFASIDLKEETPSALSFTCRCVRQAPPLFSCEKSGAATAFCFGRVSSQRGQTSSCSATVASSFSRQRTLGQAQPYQRPTAQALSVAGKDRFAVPYNCRRLATAAADSRKKATMEVPETPVVIKGEPRGIPLVGCRAADHVAVSVDPCKAAAGFAGDMIIYGLLSSKPAHGSSSSAAKEEGKSKKEGTGFSPELKELDKKITNGLLHDVVHHDEFEAKLGSHLSVRVPSGEGSGKKLVHAMALGLGAAAELKCAAAARAGAVVAALLQRNGYNRVREIGVIWPRFSSAAVHSPAGAVDVGGAAAADTQAARAAAAALPRRFVQAFLESLLVDLHPDRRFKGEGGSKEKASHLERVIFYTDELDKTFHESITAAKIVAKSVYFAQELVNAPANYCNPVSFAHAAAEMAKHVGISVKVLQQRELEDLKMLAYMSVNKGSMYPPQLIHLTYMPPAAAGEGGGAGEAAKGGGGGKSAAAGGGGGKPHVKRLVFVGKGVCFDSGGYNIKSAASSIELMKFDMAGGAAVIAAVLAIGQLRPPNVEVHAIVAACENMVSHKSYRPGDVVTAADGKTIEVGNTDAEGRVTLADALIYAQKTLHPHALIDVATLTGAAIVALGPKYAALYSTTESLAHQLLHSGESTGELMWRMPLVKEYADALDSKIADLQNVGGKNKAGSILGAIFLEHFVQNTPWAHLDIAGPAWDSKDSRATGYGVRTLVEYAMDVSRHQRSGTHA